MSLVDEVIESLKNDPHLWSWDGCRVCSKKYSLYIRRNGSVGLLGSGAFHEPEFNFFERLRIRKASAPLVLEGLKKKYPQTLNDLRKL